MFMVLLKNLKIKTDKMKIIKFFIDDAYARHISHQEFKSKAYLKWGLGEDGELYWNGQFSGHGTSGKWIGVSNKIYSISLPLSKVRSIIQRFDNLPFFGGSLLIENEYVVDNKEKL